MSQRFTTEYFIHRSNKIHDYKYDYSQTMYIFAKSKVKIICPTHGPFWQTPNDHLNKKGCAKCGDLKSSNFKKSNTEIFIKKKLKKFMVIDMTIQK